MEFALQRAESEDQITPIIRGMLPKDDTDRVRYSDVRKKTLKPFFQNFPRLSLDMICIPGDDGTFQQAMDLVSDPFSERSETALSLVPTEVLIDWCSKKPDTRYAFAAVACKLFEKQDDEKKPLAISDTALALLEAAPDKVVVVQKFIRRFRPSAGSKSTADILEARLPLLDQLAASGDEAVRSAIAMAKANLQDCIDAIRARVEGRGEVAEFKF